MDAGFTQVEVLNRREEGAGSNKSQPLKITGINELVNELKKRGISACLGIQEIIKYRHFEVKLIGEKIVLR